MTELPEFQLESYFSTHEFAIRHNLAASDAESVTIAELLTHATQQQQQSFHNQLLGYSPTYGADTLRAAIAATYETRATEDILCFAGAGEGIYVAMRVLLTPADHAIILTPCYQSAESVPAAICETTGIPLDPHENWSLDLDRLATAIQPNTRVISINFPHNPTGKILEHDRFTQLIDLCRHHGIWLFSDEAYRPLGPTTATHLPHATDLYERALSLGVLSKAHGLAGLRIGWIATQDRALLQRMERYKHYLSICNAAPTERLAEIALAASQPLLARNCQIIDQNLPLLHKFFAAHEDLFDWRPGDGGCIAYPAYRPAANNLQALDTFTTNALRQAGILFLPARVFRSTLNPTPTDRFRIGYGRADLPMGLAALEAHLQGQGLCPWTPPGSGDPGPIT